MFYLFCCPLQKSVLVIEPGSDMVDCGANCTEERKEGEQLVVRVRGPLPSVPAS